MGPASTAFTSTSSSSSLRSRNRENEMAGMLMTKYREEEGGSARGGRRGSVRSCAKEEGRKRGDCKERKGRECVRGEERVCEGA